VLPAPSPSRQYARLRDIMVDACMLPSTSKRRWWQAGALEDAPGAASTGNDWPPVLVATNFIVGRWTASAIASA
jgi:hypothetical protein